LAARPKPATGSPRSSRAATRIVVAAHPMSPRWPPQLDARYDRRRFSRDGPGGCRRIRHPTNRNRSRSGGARPPEGTHR